MAYAKQILENLDFKSKTQVIWTNEEHPYFIAVMVHDGIYIENDGNPSFIPYDVVQLTVFYDVMIMAKAVTHPDELAQHEADLEEYMQ